MFKGNFTIVVKWKDVMGLYTIRGVFHIFSKHKSNMYTFVQPRGVSIFSPKIQVSCILLYNKGGGGGPRRDPNHKSMYKCTYMYVNLSLSPPPPHINFGVFVNSTFQII